MYTTNPAYVRWMFNHRLELRFIFFIIDEISLDIVKYCDYVRILNFIKLLFLKRGNNLHRRRNIREKLISLIVSSKLCRNIQQGIIKKREKIIISSRLKTEFWKESCIFEFFNLISTYYLFAEIGKRITMNKVLNRIYISCSRLHKRWEFYSKRVSFSDKSTDLTMFYTNASCFDSSPN